MSLVTDRICDDVIRATCAAAGCTIDTSPEPPAGSIQIIPYVAGTEHAHIGSQSGDNVAGAVGFQVTGVSKLLTPRELADRFDHIVSIERAGQAEDGVSVCTLFSVLVDDLCWGHIAYINILRSVLGRITCVVMLSAS